MCQVEKWMCIGLDGLNRNDTDRLTLDRSDLPSMILTAKVSGNSWTFFLPPALPHSGATHRVCLVHCMCHGKLFKCLYPGWTPDLISSRQTTRERDTVVVSADRSILYSVKTNRVNALNKKNLNPTSSPCNQSTQGGRWPKWWILGGERGHLRPLKPILLLQWGAPRLPDRIRPWWPGFG